MSDTNNQGEKLIEQSVETPIEKPAKNWKKRTKIIVWSLIAVALVLGLVLFISEVNDEGWLSYQAGFIAACVLAWFILRRTVRTRLRMEKTVRDDPDINDWLVIHNWTTKILYVPTIIASFIAAALLQIPGINQAAVGGIWFAIFFLNFLIEEYNISVKIVIITLISIGFFLLWLHLLGWAMDFLRLFRKIAISMNSTVLLLAGILGLLTIFISWVRGLFYYISITPNYMNLQDGPTESGEQIGREDYNTKIDTSDFLERLMGFGRIIITFKDKKREPISVLVWRIQKKAERLEGVRAKFSIDLVNPGSNLSSQGR
jgi:MFS family permease